VTDRAARAAALIASGSLMLASASCGGGNGSDLPSAAPERSSKTARQLERRARHAVPPLLSRNDVYAADRPGRLSPRVRRFPDRVYVPNSKSNFTADGRYALASCEFGASLITVDIARERVVRTIRLRAGAMPQDVKLSPDGRVF
jgi:hypothetical protein